MGSNVAVAVSEYSIRRLRPSALGRRRTGAKPRWCRGSSLGTDVMTRDLERGDMAMADRAQFHVVPSGDQGVVESHAATMATAVAGVAVTVRTVSR